MQLSTFDGASVFLRTLDFIAGYPATEGKLTYDPREVIGDREGNGRWIGRVRCIGYTTAHAISIPISPLIALVRIVAMPIFFGMIVLCNPEDRLGAFKYVFVEWLRECAGVVTSPLWNIAGVVRAALGIIKPSLYLKAPSVSQLSESQRSQAAAFFHRNCSPSARV